MLVELATTPPVARGTIGSVLEVLAVLTALEDDGVLDD